MHKKDILILVLLSCAVMLSLGISSMLRAQDGTKTVLVHYMPWYASKPVSGHWGWHWTMNHFNPDTIKSNGQREVASHHYPLIDLYDSNDPHTLECHVLLMKLAGIDGVVIDWYGTEKFRDYAEIHRNTQHLITYLKRAGLKFAICYEDQTAKHMIEEKFLPKNGGVGQGQKVLKWLDNNWFIDDAYIKIGGRPILLVFGPQYFNKQQWGHIVSGLPRRPLLYGLPDLTQETGMDGAFGWPPVSGGREVVPDVWQNYLRALHSRPAARESVLSVAFPGFRDIYKDAAVHDSFGYIDHRQGKTLSETLDLAHKSKSQLIQIATWNDYGEGTVIEPTRTFGYRYLEIVQKHVQNRSSFSPKDLRLPVMLYQLKKTQSQNSARVKDLEKATDLLFAGKCVESRRIIERIAAPSG